MSNNKSEEKGYTVKSTQVRNELSLGALIFLRITQSKQMSRIMMLLKIVPTKNTKVTTFILIKML